MHPGTTVALYRAEAAYTKAMDVNFSQVGATDQGGGKRREMRYKMSEYRFNPPLTLKGNAVASGGAGIVIFAIIVAAQITLGALGFVLDHFTTLDHRFDQNKPPGAVTQHTNR